MRGRGLVRLALAEAVERMEAAGMDASLLFTGTPGVYRPSGWETFEVPVVSGPLRPDDAARPARSGPTGHRARQPGSRARPRSPSATSRLRTQHLAAPTTFPAWSAALPWQDLAPSTTRSTARP